MSTMFVQKRPSEEIEKMNIGEVVLPDSVSTDGTITRSVAGGPMFVYRMVDTTGDMVKYLVIDDDDDDFTTDVGYGVDERWLLNNRQGDQWSRIPERVPEPEIAFRELYNEQGYTIANDGRVWMGFPALPEYEPTLEDNHQAFIDSIAE